MTDVIPWNGGLSLHFITGLPREEYQYKAAVQ